MDRIDFMILGVAVLLIALVLVRGPLGLRARAAEQATLGVSDLIRHLAAEIQENREKLKAREESGQFELTSAEVEVGFVIRETTDAGGEIRAQPVVLTLGQHHGEERMHRLKVVLEPKRPARTGSTPPRKR